MTATESLGELFASLAAAQREMRCAAKDSDNPFFKSKYADLSSVWEACREALTKQKLCVLQPCSADGSKVSVTTIIGSAGGQWLSEVLTVTAKDGSPQAIGSAITYARRYGLASMVGVAPDDDDDGEAAQPRPTQPHVKPKPAPARNGSHMVIGHQDVAPEPAPADAAKVEPAKKLPEPVQPQPIAERAHGWAKKLELQGLTTAEHAIGWITLQLGPLDKVAPGRADDARTACTEYLRRLKAGEFVKKEEPQEEIEL